MNDERELAAHGPMMEWLRESGVQFLPLDAAPALSIISRERAIALARSMPGVEELSDARTAAFYGLYTSTQSSGPSTIRNRLVWIVVRSEVQWRPSGFPASGQSLARGQCVDVIDAASGEWLRGHLHGEG